MKKVLLLGDSIRMSYQSLVSETLSGKAEVLWPDENCRFAKYTLWCTSAWLEQLGNPDIIHWNNGIWDIYRQNDDMGIFTRKEDYVRDIGRVLQELRKTKAQIIWATTTAVGEQCVTCRNEDIDAYNKEAVDFMRRESVPVNDLNAVVRSNMSQYIAEDYVHLTQDGQRACAQAVSACITSYVG